MLGRVIIMSLIGWVYVTPAFALDWALARPDLGMVKSYDRYELIIFDQTAPMSLRALQDSDKTSLSALPLNGADEKEEARRLLETELPALIHKGFGGIMLKPAENADQQTISRLIKAIHLHYPQLTLYLKDQLTVAEQVAAYINGVVLENSDEDSEGLQNSEARLAAFSKAYPHLKILTLDVVQADDAQARQNIARLRKEQGFFPYITSAHKPASRREAGL